MAEKVIKLWENLDTQLAKLSPYERELLPDQNGQNRRDMRARTAGPQIRIANKGLGRQLSA